MIRSSGLPLERRRPMVCSGGWLEPRRSLSCPVSPVTRIQNPGRTGAWPSAYCLCQGVSSFCSSMIRSVSAVPHGFEGGQRIAGLILLVACLQRAPRSLSLKTSAEVVWCRLSSSNLTRDLIPDFESGKQFWLRQVKYGV